MNEKSKLDSMVKKIVAPKPFMAGKARIMKSHCGKPGCRCMRKSNPEKHVYRQLSCTKDKKTKTMYIRKADFELVQKLNENYIDFRQVTLELGHEVVLLSKKYGVDVACEMMMSSFDRVKRKSIGLKPESQLLRETRASRDRWKRKALARQSDLAGKAVRIRDVEKSRDNWKKKALDAQKRLGDCQKELDNANRQIYKLKKSTDNKKNSAKAN